MAKPFFERFKNHISEIANVLKGNASACSIFPNTSDVGLTRENIYVEFLRQHCPTNCKVSLGGFLFGQDGCESKQIDVIITNSKTLQFNWHNKNENGKIFAAIDGCVGVASIKSNLTRAELNDALDNIGSLPLKQPLIKERVPSGAKISSYEDWPYKIIYATTGAELKTIKDALIQYYNANPGAPEYSKPNLIHVIGKYVIIRKSEITSIGPDLKKLHIGHNFYCFPDKHNVGLFHVIKDLQNFAQGSEAIAYYYNELFNNFLSKAVFNGEEAIEAEFY